MLLLALACSDYNLNRDEDVDPGVCDPPEVYTVEVDDDCTSSGGVGSFDPVVEWQWTGWEGLPTYTHVVSTPVVGDLTDDDGDGVLGDGDTPDIVFTAFQEKEQTKEGVLVAISGDGSGTHWMASVDVYGNGGVALGDLDGDGWPEICASSMTHSIVCTDRFGNELFRAGDRPAYNGHPAIADFNGDGRAEIAYGAELFTNTGVRLWAGDGGIGGRSATHASVPVDLDGDGIMELVAGNTVYNFVNGTVRWDDGMADGYPAIGNFDDDKEPEIVRVIPGSLLLLDSDGTLIWESAIDREDRGGPPTVADFDGDGEPEIGVAGYATYTVVDTDGSVLWQNPTDDNSSSITGSSVFDFEGDGRAEVLYADEESLWVYDGATGEVLLQLEQHASNTRLEYPVIADVDGDGATEIILASVNAWWDGWDGITIIGDAENSWAPARRIWNQHAYHITNVDNFGGIPEEQVPNWQSWNNFRAAGTEYGPSVWRANLVPGEPAVCTAECQDGLVTVWVPVENQGQVPAKNVIAKLGSETSELGRLEPGEVGVAAFAMHKDTWGNFTIDPDDTISECDEANTVDLGPWPCL